MINSTMVIDYAWNWPNSDVYGLLFINLFVSLYCSDVGFYCTTIKVSAVFVFFFCKFRCSSIKSYAVCLYCLFVVVASMQFIFIA